MCGVQDEAGAARGAARAGMSAAVGRAARCGRLGGKTVWGREPVGGMGFAAYFADSEGNVLGLWQTAGS